MGKPGRPRHPDVLTPREWEVLALLGDGLSNDQIAQRLGISFDGAKYHVSEIITKLGVRDRHEAAQWRLDAGDASPQRLFAPLLALRRVHLSSLATPISVATIGLVIVVVGALAWGVFAMRDGAATSRLVAPVPCPTAIASVGMVPGVGFVDIDASTCVHTPLGDQYSRAQWVDDGRTIVAYDNAAHDYKILDLSGNVLREIATPPSDRDFFTAQVHSAHDGHTLIVERDNSPMTLLDTRTGDERPLALPSGTNSNVFFSPLGGQFIFTNQSGNAVSLMLSRSAGAPPATLVRSLAADAFLSALAWSPDGSSILVWSGTSTAPCKPAPEPACFVAASNYEVVDTAGTVIWLMPLPDFGANDARVTSVEWAGAGRLLISQPAVTAKDGTFLAAAARFVDVRTGAQMTAPSELANVAELSPDGRFGVVSDGTGCAIIDIRSLARLLSISCTITDWTDDSKTALTSFGGT